MNIARRLVYLVKQAFKKSLFKNVKKEILDFFPAPNEIQYVDNRGYIFPWYTFSFLQELDQWPLADLEIFEAGGGTSTIWWASRCKHVTTLETNMKWADKIQAYCHSNHVNNVQLIRVDSRQKDSRMVYLQTLEKLNKKFDIIIIDGDPVKWRGPILKVSEHYVKPKGRIIADNYLQRPVWFDPESITIINHLNNKYKVHVFEQDHEEWKTAYWQL